MPACVFASAICPSGILGEVISTDSEFPHIIEAQVGHPNRHSPGRHLYRILAFIDLVKHKMKMLQTTVTPIENNNKIAHHSTR